MSNDALTWAWGAAIGSGPKFVLVALADHGSDHSGEDWTCFPSVERLMGRTGFSRSAVERHLRALEADGWLTRKRRRRPDGKLGIYDYQLHRDPGLRSGLKAERNQADAPGNESGEPQGDLTHGPGGNLTDAMRQFGVQPQGNLPHQEPSGLTLKEPSLRARGREPGAEGFEAGLAAYPESGRVRTDWPAARAAWAWAVGLVGEPALLAAVVRYASEDRDLKTGDFGACRFEAWLSGERWRPWLAAGPGEAIGAVAWPGPAEVRTAFVAALGEAAVVGSLDPAGWREADRTVLARSSFAAGRLAEARAVVAEQGLKFEISKREIG